MNAVAGFYHGNMLHETVTKAPEKQVSVSLTAASDKNHQMSSAEFAVASHLQAAHHERKYRSYQHRAHFAGLYCNVGSSVQTRER